MLLVVLFTALVLVPVVLLVRARRGHPGERSSDPQGNRNLHAHGGASSPGSTGAGPGGDYPGASF